MSTFIFDRLTYTIKTPHSRIEKFIYDIINKQSGGGGGSVIIVDDPSDVGTGLQVNGNYLTIDAEDTIKEDSEKPVTSGAIKEQMDVVEEIMSRI